ncbi:MAG: hypothetical protein RSB52_08565 [Acidaminococcaceae bacterium]
MSINDIRERLTELREAERKILKSQRYKVGNRENERARLATVQEAIKEVEKQLAMASNAGRTKRVILKDY